MPREQQFLLTLGQQMAIPCIQKRSATPNQHAGVKNLCQKFWEVTNDVKLEKSLTLLFFMSRLDFPQEK
jgi:hypothetical protein